MASERRQKELTLTLIRVLGCSISLLLELYKRRYCAIAPDSVSYKYWISPPLTVTSSTSKQVEDRISTSPSNKSSFYQFFKKEKEDGRSEELFLLPIFLVVAKAGKPRLVLKLTDSSCMKGNSTAYGLRRGEYLALTSIDEPRKFHRKYVFPFADKTTMRFLQPHSIKYPNGRSRMIDIEGIKDVFEKGISLNDNKQIFKFEFAIDNSRKKTYYFDWAQAEIKYNDDNTVVKKPVKSDCPPPLLMNEDCKCVCPKGYVSKECAKLDK
ncbi:Oidioi.mRNA.OKI2018_I69.XSR.g16772.t1.cds [Oikopleura dioica]|uniref:Oidioi.mRNA.OKI2018_I69.XSR.g16772.t1.cds n=1 Tax=Oikopleura dioica TaxID=34765 RepID=A0ABN7SRJ7_OIKDI|nr:Oidioi.mRNA.OKI2018_I69.XSR.g16772.t1.cds [Oikopleura dioica]